MIKDLVTDRFDAKIVHVSDNLFQIKNLGIYKFHIAIMNPEDPHIYKLEWQTDMD